MKQFEYKVVTRLIGIERKLNELGYEGWELVAWSVAHIISNENIKNKKRNGKV